MVIVPLTALREGVAWIVGKHIGKVSEARETRREFGTYSLTCADLGRPEHSALWHHLPPVPSAGYDRESSQSLARSFSGTFSALQRGAARLLACPGRRDMVTFLIFFQIFHHFRE